MNMYGSISDDLVVKYYDEAFAIGSEAEMNWYVQKAKEKGGTVLDLACGTGRFAIWLAREGFKVTAVDQSQGMLERFKAKLSREPEEVQDRIRIEPGEMPALSLDFKFNTVICCDAFFHNLTVETQIQTLERVWEHLNPGGQFLFNLPNPTCDFILKNVENQGRVFTERGRYPLSDGSGFLLVEHAQDGNVLEQTIHTTLRITRYDHKNNLIEKGSSSWSSRYLFRFEAVHLLYRCGFTIQNLVGDYSNGPVTESGQLIFQAVRPK